MATVACGGDSDDDSSSPPPTVAAQPTAAGGQSGGSANTRVTMVDFAYSPTTLTARVGQQVSLDVVNNGQAPHTFTITGVVDSGTINSGQTRVVSFTPSQAGTLQFICVIHGAAAMSGTVTVQ
jgi:plastocyanin